MQEIVEVLSQTYLFFCDVELFDVVNHLLFEAVVICLYAFNLFQSGNQSVFYSLASSGFVLLYFFEKFSYQVYSFFKILFQYCTLTNSVLVQLFGSLVSQIEKSSFFFIVKLCLFAAFDLGLIENVCQKVGCVCPNAHCKRVKRFVKTDKRLSVNSQSHFGICFLYCGNTIYLSPCELFRKDISYFKFQFSVTHR